MRTSVKYMVIYRRKDKYSISEMCRFFEVSRRGCYDYVKRMDTPAWELPLAEKIRECQAHSHSTYGYRRVHIWLARQRIHKDPKTVLRVCRNTIRFLLSDERNTAIMASICTDIPIYSIEISAQIVLIGNG